MRNLLGRLLTRHLFFLIACALLLAAFQFLIAAIVSEVDMEAALEQIMVFAPPLMQSIINDQMLGGSTEGMLSFGWNHPIAHAVFAAVPISLGARAIAGEVENGVIELVLAQPVSRATYLAAHVLFAMLATAAVALAGVAGSLIGDWVFDLNALSPGRLLRLAANAAWLQLAIYSLALLISAHGREAGRVAGAAVLLTVVSYLVAVLATLWAKAAFLMPYSLHNYYNPRGILVEQRLAAQSVLVLAAFSAACTALAYWRFRTRDLP